jgi:DNA replication protein DnaC
MSDLLSIGQHLERGVGLPVGMPASDVSSDQSSDANRRPLTFSTRRSHSSRKTTASSASSAKSELSLGAKLAAISVQREADRQERIAQRRAVWEADRRGWRGKCPACLDQGRDYLTELDCRCAAGQARAAERERRHLEILRETIANDAQRVIAAAAIPPEYHDWTLENFPRQTRTLATLQKWAADWNERDGLILFGHYGTGKTSLMIGLLRILARDYLTRHYGGVIRARFKRASQFLAELRAAMDAHDGAYDRLMMEAEQVRLFVLDDLGRENPKSEWVSETLFEILDARYAHGLPILATTNYRPDDLAARLGVHGDAIMERINDRCVWLEVKGASMRKSQPRVIELPDL